MSYNSYEIDEVTHVIELNGKKNLVVRRNDGVHEPILLSEDVYGSITALEEKIGATASQGSGLANLYRVIEHGVEDAHLLITGTSIEDTMSEWPYLMALDLVSRFSTHTIVFHQWNTTSLTYDAALVLGVGSGAKTLHIWNGSGSGYQTWSALTHAPLLLQIEGNQAHAVICSYSHNEGLGTVTIRGKITAFLDRVFRRHPQTGITWVLSNPRTDNDDQAHRIRIISEVCAAYSVSTVNVYDAFRALGDFSAYMNDAVHPNALGQSIYREKMEEAWDAAEWAQSTGPNDRVGIGENLIKRPRLHKIDASFAPVDWTAVNVTFAQDTVNFETGTSAVKATQTTEGTDAYYYHRPDPGLRAMAKGQWVTFAVRLFIPKPTPPIYGTQWDLVAINDGLTTTTTVGNTQHGYNMYRWAIVHHFVPIDATDLRFYIYVSRSSTDIAEVTTDRVVAFRGVGFHDDINPDMDLKTDLNSVLQAGETDVITGRYASESSDRIRVRMDGVYFGSGTGAPDVRLGRGAADRLRCFDAFLVDGAFGANGATPVTRRTLGAAATDQASAITLANNLRQALIDIGLGQT